MNKLLKIGIFIISGIFVIIVLVFWLFPILAVDFQVTLATYQNKWFAFYLDDGQILYSQLAGWNGREFELKNIYYLKTVQNGSSTLSNLVRRGQIEISAPENYLMVNRNKIIYWEQVGEKSQFFAITKEKQ